LIKINLLDDLRDTDFSVGKKFYQKTPFKLFAFVVLLGLGWFGYKWAVQKDTNNTEDPIAAVPQRQEFKAPLVYSQVVEELAREIENEQRLAPRTPNYADLKPGAQIEYQLYSARKALQFFREKTTPRVGFTHLVFSTPGDIYLRGLSITQNDYDVFYNQLKQSTELSITEGQPPQKTGEKGVRREFSLYGKFRFGETPASTNRLVPPNEIGDELQALSQRAQSLGIRFSSPELQSSTTLGPVKQKIYALHAQGIDFPAFYQFINALYLGQARTGIAKFSLRATGDETLDVELSILIYNP